jgi:hypothetical protein
MCTVYEEARFCGIATSRLDIGSAHDKLPITEALILNISQL